MNFMFLLEITCLKHMFAFKKLFFALAIAGSTSFPGGNLVDGLPPALSASKSNTGVVR